MIKTPAELQAAGHAYGEDWQAAEHARREADEADRRARAYTPEETALRVAAAVALGLSPEGPP